MPTNDYADAAWLTARLLLAPIGERLLPRRTDILDLDDHMARWFPWARSAVFLLVRLILAECLDRRAATLRIRYLDDESDTECVAFVSTNDDAKARQPLRFVGFPGAVYADVVALLSAVTPVAHLGRETQISVRHRGRNTLARFVVCGDTLQIDFASPCDGVHPVASD